jgi:hypothetical protein
MKPHFVLVISPDKIMISRTKLLLKSIEQYGGCKNYHCTIFVLEGDKIHDQFILSRAEIIEYAKDNLYQYPWSAMPRWNVVPQSEIIVALDCDVLCLSNIQEFLKTCSQKKIYGVIASTPPFENSLDTWKLLYSRLGMELPHTLFGYRKFKNNFFMDKTTVLTPFYINHGVIAINSELVPKIREQVKIVTPQVNKIFHDNFFIPQIVTTLAISMANVEYEAIEPKYNSLTNLDTIDNNTVFYHYCHYNKSYDFYKLVSPFVQKKIDGLHACKIL